ncbi:MAG: hypothetical protein HY815_30630 [Candidatus Riflebacteria bacterium]|nr:hypothetical protein [Candidatus Riflebacteria bacterium]
MKKNAVLVCAVLMVPLLCGLPASAQPGRERPAAQTKVGVVRLVDVVGKRIVVMVARELTFTVTATTRIHQRDAVRGLADVAAGASVRVRYARTGDTRMATNIAIFSAERRKVDAR